MSEGAFSADWLALREPVDHRSRATDLLPPLVAAWEVRGWRRIVDLGSGTGSNVRFLALRLPGSQAWHLVDHDPELLARATGPEAAGLLETTVGTLEAEGIEAVADADLVTASALLDIVDEGLLGRLVEACRSASCGVYVALTYDGTTRWTDAAGEPDVDPDDELVRTAVNAHQQRERGDRTALGPTGGRVAERRFAAAGFRTWRRPSPWRLGPADADLARALVDGWRQAALELDPDPAQATRIDAWADRRRATVEGVFGLTVGHDDVLALPADIVVSTEGS